MLPRALSHTYRRAFLRAVPRHSTCVTPGKLGVVGVASHSQLRRYTHYAELPEEASMVRDQARQYAEEVLMKTAAKNDAEHLYPAKEIKGLGELGFLGINVKEEYGGPGGSALMYSLAMEEISRGCPSCGLVMSINNSLYCGGLQRFGSDAMKQTLESYCYGEKIGCFALSEPGNGSDAAAASTTAVLDSSGDFYTLNGTKQWISNCYEGHSVLVFATTNKEKKHKGITCFRVDLGTAGTEQGNSVTLGLKEDKLGIRATSTAQVIFENVKVSKEDIVGEEGDGFKIAMQLLDAGRIGIASQALGIAQASLDIASKYANEREAFGKKIGSLYAIQEKIAEMDIRLWSARLLTWQAASLKDQNLPYTLAGARAKYAASKAATYCSNEAIQILGGMGFVSDMPAERYFRDARITEIYEGTSEINKMVVGMKVLKESSEVEVAVPDHYRKKW